jgi:hypothetical protein
LKNWKRLAILGAVTCATGLALFVFRTPRSMEIRGTLERFPGTLPQEVCAEAYYVAQRCIPFLTCKPTLYGDWDHASSQDRSCAPVTAAGTFVLSVPRQKWASIGVSRLRELELNYRVGERTARLSLMEQITASRCQVLSGQSQARCTGRFGADPRIEAILVSSALVDANQRRDRLAEPGEVDLTIQHLPIVR